MPNHSGADSPVPQYSDPQVFQRVWNRVMPDQTLSPVEIVPPAPSIAAAPAAAEEMPIPPPWGAMPRPGEPGGEGVCGPCRPQEAPVPPPAWQTKPAGPWPEGGPLSPHQAAQPTPFQWPPARPVLARTEAVPPADLSHPGCLKTADIPAFPCPPQVPEKEGESCYPVEEGVGQFCFSCDSMPYLLRLEEMMDDLRKEAAVYQALSHRATGRLGRSLSVLCDEVRGNLRQLGAAYFLITGARYQPHEPCPPPRGETLATGLRQQFMKEQRWSTRFARAAAEAADPCLRELFEQLEQESASRARRIRTAVEQLHC